MKLFIWNGKVLAWHRDDQDVDDKYPGSELVIVPNDTLIGGEGILIPDDPRLTMTPEQQLEVTALTSDYHGKIANILENLPSRAQVRNAINAISNLADAKAFLLNLSDVVYWLAKGRLE